MILCLQPINLYCEQLYTCVIDGYIHLENVLPFTNIVLGAPLSILIHELRSCLGKVRAQVLLLDIFQHCLNAHSPTCNHKQSTFCCIS